MKKKKASPPEKKKIGGSLINAGDLRELKAAWKGRDLTLFLGAGISMDYGIPSWPALVLKMLYDQAESARRFKALKPQYLRALASWMADYFDYNPLVLARLIENEIRERQPNDPAAANMEFIKRLREHLYSGLEKPGRDTSLRAVARMIKRAGTGGNLAAVFTFNFDDLLEEELRLQGVSTASLSKGKRLKPGEVNIIHPHGFVPQTPNGAGREELVFTEDNYHSLTSTTFHWALTEIVAHLRQHRALFVGLSMSDPNLRRLLDASRFSGDRPWHWQIQKRHTVRDADLLKIMSDIEERASRFADELKIPRGRRKPPAELAAVIGDTLRQADTYDRRVYEDMGLKTIWIEDWGDLPKLLDEIKN